jgi:hypothetical protein
MLNHMKPAALALAATTMIAAMTTFVPLHARAAQSAGVVWAANPVGAQTIPDAASIALLPSSGYVPLQTSAGKCLLVARRGTQIVAIELSPLKIGAKVIGWKPQTIDMDTLTSKWGYQPPQSSIDTKGFGNPVTAQIAGQTKTDTKSGSYSTSSTWGNSHVESASTGESEAAVTVTANGKTYRKYSHFKPATPEAPVASSDEYFCQ